MRIGIFSDTHANVEALTAVLGAFKKEGVDKYVCLGDTVGYGANPNECCDMVRDVAAFTILGNHDAAVAGRMDYSYYYDAARQALDLHASLLTAENMKWLQSLPYEVREGGSGEAENKNGTNGKSAKSGGAKDHTIAFVHGSPVNIEEFEYIFAPEQAARCLPEWDHLGDVTFIGHSHLCKSFALSPDDVHEVVAQKFELRAGHKYIISVGSVGQPRDYDNRASYTIYDSQKRVFEFKRVAYDIDSAAQKIFSAKLERNFGNRLFIGV